MTKQTKYFTKEAALKAVVSDSYELNFCSPELQANEEVVLAAITPQSWAFQYASDELKSNKVFIMKTLNEGVEPWGLMAYLNINIRSDLEVITLAVEKSDDGWVFQYAKGEVAFDKGLAAKAMVKFGNLCLWGCFIGGVWQILPQANGFHGY